MPIAFSRVCILICVHAYILPWASGTHEISWGILKCQWTSRRPSWPECSSAVIPSLASMMMASVSFWIFTSHLELAIAGFLPPFCLGECRGVWVWPAPHCPTHDCPVHSWCLCTAQKHIESGSGHLHFPCAHGALGVPLPTPAASF